MMFKEIVQALHEGRTHSRSEVNALVYLPSGDLTSATVREDARVEFGRVIFDEDGSSINDHEMTIRVGVTGR